MVVMTEGLVKVGSKDSGGDGNSGVVSGGGSGGDRSSGVWLAGSVGRAWVVNSAGPASHVSLTRVCPPPSRK